MFENDLAEMLSLNGTWEFAPGESSPYMKIQVPGCWEAQGYPKTFEGPARCRRSVHLPAGWSGKSIQLEFGAVSYACDVSINSYSAGSHKGLWTPFSFDITAAARPGEDNVIELEAIKPGLGSSSRYPFRSSLAGFIPDLADTFGGIWQPVRLRAFETAFSELQIAADYNRRSVQVTGKAEIFDHPLSQAEWDVQVSYRGRPVSSFRAPLGPDLSFSAVLPLSHVNYWSPEHPCLYTVQIRLLDQGRPLAQVSRSVGFRKLSTRGEQLLLNGKPYMVRGILAWGWEPDRIAPYYTFEQAREEIRRVRSMGFNCIKLCLFVPNPAYFQAADAEGILLWQEFPMWLPEVTPSLRAQAPIEYADLAAMVSQHPSVAVCSLGCELNRSVDLPLLQELNRVVRSRFRDGLICDNSGSGESYGGLDIDFSDFTDYHPYYDIHYFEPLLDHWRRDWQSPRPWIFGEFCDSDTFRDLDEIIQANGGEPPWWMTKDNPVTAWRSEAQALLDEDRRLAEAGLQHLKPELIRISYAQAAAIRKYTLETLRRKRSMGGYIITGLRDTAISTSGIWDDLGRPKWPPSEFIQTNGEDILTIDLDRRRTWHFGGDRPDRLDPFCFWSGSQARWHIILHASQRPFPPGSRLRWQLTSPGNSVYSSGEFIIELAAPAGIPSRLGVIECALPAVSRARQLDLQIALSAPGGRTVTNHWPVWVYPAPGSPPASLALFDPSGILSDWGDWLASLPQLGQDVPYSQSQLILSAGWNPSLARSVEAGARVLLIQMGSHPLPARRCPFWREAVKFFLPHPLWEKFPHSGFTDMQFCSLASDTAFDRLRLAKALPASAQIRPLLSRLDAREFHLSDYIFEARLGKGLLLACSLRLAGGAGAQPTGLRRNISGAALLHAMLDYLQSLG